jgi:predicted Zn-dependent peptidase
MADRQDKHILGNGLVLLGEPMEAVGSAAFGFILPVGAAVVPAGCCGASNVISDWIFRGAGERDNRGLSDALDGLGIHRASSVGSRHMAIGATLEAENLAEALGLHADVILRARLEQGQFELARQLAVDAVLGLDDDPRQKVMLELRERFYPSPLGRNTLGDVDELKALTAYQTREIVTQHFDLSQTIFSVAGKYDFDAITRQIEDLFETERRGSVEPAAPSGNGDAYTQIDSDSAQVHIGLMVPAVNPCDEDYYNVRVAVSVLSGGMSARLFTEVREKRGLCYAIGARYHGLKEAAGIMCYAGTTPDKAQETLDVIMAEFNRLAEGISKEEIERAKVGLKSTLILQSESSSSRAGGIGTDYYMLGRVRSLDEIKEKIEQTTVDSVLGYLRDNRFENFTVVTIGPEPVSIKE